MENSSEIKDQAALLGLLIKKPKDAASLPFCGFQKTPEALEELLWKYAEGEMDAQEQEKLEDHTDDCSYCTQQLAIICQSLLAVDQEMGFSKKKVAALLARKKQLRERGLGQKIHHYLKPPIFPDSHYWKPLTAGLMTAFLIVLTTLYVQRLYPPPLGKVITSATLQRLPDQVTVDHILKAITAYPDREDLASPRRALLPEADKNLPISFIDLGYHFQNLETLLSFSPLEEKLTSQVGGLTENMEILLKSQGAPEALYKAMALFRERVFSTRYNGEELKELLLQIKADLFQFADRGEYTSYQADQALELGMWLSYLHRELSWQIQGLDRQAILKDLLVAAYIDRLDRYCSKHLSKDTASALKPAFKTLSSSAEQIKLKALTSDHAEASLQALNSFMRLFIR